MDLMDFWNIKLETYICINKDNLKKEQSES